MTLESLHAIKLAIEMTTLTNADIECIFYNNAVELLNLNPQESM